MVRGLWVFFEWRTVGMDRKKMSGEMPLGGAARMAMFGRQGGILVFLRYHGLLI
jgi:hypothetical protein